MKHDQTPGFQNCKIGSGQESKMAIVTKNSKKQQIFFFSRTIRYNGYKFVWNISGTLVFKIVKIKKSTAELGHSDLLSVYSPISLRWQYLKKTEMYFGQIRSQWSLNGTISY